MHYHSFLFSVMCKRSYVNADELKSRRKRVVLPSSASSSQVTTPKNVISSSSSSTSRREISTTFFSSSPRSPREGPNTPRFSSSPRQSQGLETRSSAWVVKDEARSGGNSPRIFLPQLKRGKLKRRVTIGSTLSESSGSGDAEEADWPPFADEDYIVFCFEGDGAFHVMEESPKATSQKLHCEEHGNLTCACSDETKGVDKLKILNRRDCLLPNKEAEEESGNSHLSPKLLIDVSDYLLVNKFTLEDESTESMECRNGSVESTDSSQLDDDDHEHLENKNMSPVEHSSSPWDMTGQDGEDDNAFPAFGGDFMLPNTEVDEEDRIPSLNSQMTMMLTINELLKRDDDLSSVESNQSRGFSKSESKGDHEDQLEGNEMVSESAKTSVSRHSNISSGSFKFPVLEGEWIGSPVMWPRPGKAHHRRRKAQPACLRCCKF